MKSKRIRTAALALAMAATAPAVFSQDREKPEGDNPRAAKPEANSPRPDAGRDKKREQPERDMRKDGDRDTARKPEPKREQPEGSRPHNPRAENPRDGDRLRDESPRSGEMRTFLGVATSSVHPALREHLDLAEGFGIQVEQVLEESPAGKAGLKKSDILTLLNDQRLIGPEHLSLLVRSMDPGEKISLTIIRKGKEQTLDVELGDKPESDFGPTGGRGPVQREPWRESMERNQDYWRKWMEQNGRSNPSGPNLLERDARNTRPQMPEGRPPAVSVRPGFPVKIFGAGGIMKIDNEEGKLTITEENGQHHIVIENKEGDTVYDGDFDPKKGVNSLPVEAQEQLEVMKLENLEILTPPKENESPEETSTPRPPHSGGQPL